MASGSERARLLAVLGLPASADDREVTRAYHRLARESHPDMSDSGASASDQHAQRFLEVSDAYHRILAMPAPPTASDNPVAPPAADRPSSQQPPVEPLGFSRPVAGRWPRDPAIVAGPVVVTPPREGRPGRQ